MFLAYILIFTFEYINKSEELLAKFFRIHNVSLQQTEFYKNWLHSWIHSLKIHKLYFKIFSLLLIVQFFVKTTCCKSFFRNQRFILRRIIPLLGDQDTKAVPSVSPGNREDSYPSNFNFNAFKRTENWIFGQRESILIVFHRPGSEISYQYKKGKVKIIFPLPIHSSRNSYTHKKTYLPIIYKHNHLHHASQ